MSVIIPVGKDDHSWQSLLPDLAPLSSEDEILFVYPAAGSGPEQKSLTERLALEGRRWGLQAPCRWLWSESGRAKQLNSGAKAAAHRYLWFLHCDSRLPAHGIQKLKEQISTYPPAVLFFNLKFLADGPFFMRLNEKGVWLRSHLLRLPFGDQGFSMSRETFNQLGGFNEKAPYGEDHLLIWKAHQMDVSVRGVGESIQTSARRYAEKGWARTTGRHLAMTLRQAAPELLRWLQGLGPK